MFKIGVRKRIGLLIVFGLSLALVLGACARGVPQEQEQDAKYWSQLTSVFMPVELPLMTDHTAFMTPGGLMVGLHFDNLDISKAQNLNWLVIGVPGKFSKQDQDRIEKLYGKGFTHFHDLMADTHGGPPGVEGVWFIHIAVREFDAPWGHLEPGIDENFMPTPPPE